MFIPDGKKVKFGEKKYIKIEDTRKNFRRTAHAKKPRVRIRLGKKPNRRRQQHQNLPYQIPLRKRKRVNNIRRAVKIQSKPRPNKRTEEIRVISQTTQAT